MSIESWKNACESWRATALLAALLAILIASNGGVQGQELPWTKNPCQTGVKRAASMKELLVNVDASHWDSLLDGESLSVNEDETLNRILFRLPRISGYDWKRLAQPLGDAHALAAAPQPARGNTFRIE